MVQESLFAIRTGGGALRLDKAPQLEIESVACLAASIASSSGPKISGAQVLGTSIGDRRPLRNRRTSAEPAVSLTMVKTARTLLPKGAHAKVLVVAYQWLGMTARLVSAAPCWHSHDARCAEARSASNARLHM